MEFVQLDEKRLDEVSEDWLSQADSHPSEVLRFDYEAVLAQMRRTITHMDGASACGVYDDERDTMPALLVLQHAREGFEDSWLKMLQIYLEPELDAAVWSETADLGRLGEIVTAAALGGWEATFETYPSSELKIRGRDTLALEFLSGVLADNEKLSERHVIVRTHGRWVILQPPESAPPEM